MRHLLLQYNFKSRSVRTLLEIYMQIGYKSIKKATSGGHYTIWVYIKLCLKLYLLIILHNLMRNWKSFTIIQMARISFIHHHKDCFLSIKLIKLTVHESLRECSRQTKVRRPLYDPDHLTAAVVQLTNTYLSNEATHIFL